MALQQMALVGREREQQQLGDLLDAACAGRGRLVLVSGEAGIGKTTLVRDLVEKAHEQGALVLSGSCYDLTITPPYGPWSEAIRGYQPKEGLPEIPDWFGNLDELEKFGSQAAIFDEARAFFAEIAEGQPLVIVLEDMHWSDPASLDALRYLGRALADTAILLIVTYRDDELTRRHGLYQILPLLVRESQAQRIHLNRLDQEDVRDLVERYYDLEAADYERLAAHVAERSECNPFFAGEILQGLEDEQVLRPVDEGWALGKLDQRQVPPLLRQVLDTRLANLAPETRTALQVAAVIGQEVPLDLWRIVGELDDAEFDAVTSAALEIRLLEETSDALALQFRHALLREALYESLHISRRRNLHREAGSALMETSNPDPDVIAHHFRQAGDEREIEWLIRAGLRARRSAAWFTAVERFQRAAALLEDHPSRTRERGWLLLYAVFLSRYFDDLRYSELLDEAERLAAEVDDRALAASIRFHRGIRYGIAGQIRRGIQELRDAVEAFERLEDVEHVAPIDVLAPAILRSLLGEGDQRTRTASLPDETVRRQPSKFGASVLANWLASAGHLHEALEIGEASIAEMKAAIGDDYLQTISGAAGHFGIAKAYAALGRLKESQDAYDTARSGYEFVGDYSWLNLCLASKLLVLTIPYWTDQINERRLLVADADTAWHRAVGLLSEADVGSSAALIVDLIEGRWDEVRQRSRALASAGFASHHVQIGTTSLGVLSRYKGQPELAWEQIRKLLPEGPSTEPGDSYFPGTHRIQQLAAELALDAGDLDLAREWIEAHGRWQEWSGAMLWRADHLLLEARYQQVAGDIGQAQEHAEAALVLASDPRQPLVLVAAHRLLGEIAIRDKRFAEAEKHLEESLSLAEACAAPFEQAQTLLVLAELATATGKLDEAWKMLDQVRVICTPLEATPTLRRATEIAAKLSVRRGQAVHPAGLTPRELEVLQLVAGGMTNAEVGDALFISSRTVAQHLRSVYNKLGVDSRVEATRFAVEHGLVDSSTA